MLGSFVYSCGCNLVTINIIAIIPVIHAGPMPRKIAYYKSLYEVVYSQTEEVMSRVLQMPVVERKNQRKYPGSHASICSRTWWCACSLLPSCQVQAARRGRKTHLKCRAEVGPHKSLSHNACESHSGPQSNRVCQRAGCNCATREPVSAGSKRGVSEGKRGKGLSSPEERQNSRLWAALPWSALETDQTDAPTALSTTPSLPVPDVRPRALVDGVVDRHDYLHVRRAGIVLLARHRGVELCLGGVDPVFVVAAGDRGELAGGGE